MEKSRRGPRHRTAMAMGYSSEQDKLAVSEVIDFAKSKLRRFSAFRSSFVEDGKELLIRIKNVYDEKSGRDKISFPFSVNRLVECLLLATSALYSQYSGALWFKLIRNTRLIWFMRISRMSIPSLPWTRVSCPTRPPSPC